VIKTDILATFLCRLTENPGSLNLLVVLVVVVMVVVVVI
jgi:hypothetical protein